MEERAPEIIEHHHSASKVLLWIGVLVITFAAGAASAWVYLQSQPEIPVVQQEPVPIDEPEDMDEKNNTPKPTYSLKYSKDLDISFLLPTDWEMHSENEITYLSSKKHWEKNSLYGESSVYQMRFRIDDGTVTIPNNNEIMEINDLNINDQRIIILNNGQRASIGWFEGIPRTAIAQFEINENRYIAEWNYSGRYEDIYLSILQGMHKYTEYDNSVWGFSFQYPSNWSIESDNLPDEVVISTSLNQNLIIGDLVLLINPGGFGVGCPDTDITFERQGDGLEIINEENFTYDDPSVEICYRDPSEETYSIHAHEQLSEASSIQDRKIYMKVNTADPTRGMNIMKAIISTFKFN